MTKEKIEEAHLVLRLDRFIVKYFIDIDSVRLLTGKMRINSKIN